MKQINVVLLLLCTLAGYATASSSAGGYQALLFWYCYRMDIDAFGVRDGMFAPNCFGSMSDETCKFSELLNYLQRDGQKLASGSTLSFDGQQWPDVATANAEINKLKLTGNRPFVQNIDPSKLALPGASTLPTNGNPRLSDILDMVTDKIQAARSKLGDAALGDGIKGMQNAITGVHEARRLENASDMINSLNDYLKGKNLPAVSTKSFTSFDGAMTWTDIDMETSAGKITNFDTNFNDFKKYLLTQKRTNKTPLGQARMHMEAAEGVQKYNKILFGPVSCKRKAED
ncbi:hypothetical protein K461DRAFT_289528 [Myriangium duriaei CBS 260.36]|uniref:Uncharacterized protein n=1 Tax=Myriangium duriaei CBS 260.36 TaxID=1168546 RepID=A0A9P4J8U5_9PEZI|nr:hypothetical protein K461DRAFT_289528 [Myriangium duriaei CBS 260.36]